MTGSTRYKGNVLEDLVALLHRTMGATVETRVMLPVVDEPDAVAREIDVLVSYDVMGFPTRIAFECKNEAALVGIGYVDAFVGKLLDVGIPTAHGILVSPVGFTKDARRRAAKAGIRLLLFEGLNEERLAAEINAALLHLVHLVLFVHSMSMFAYLPGGAPGDAWPDDVPFNEIGIQNHLWRQWVAGSGATAPGERVQYFRAGDGGAVVECRVVAFVGRIEGSASLLQLRNVPSGTVDRRRLEAEFSIPNTVALEAFDTAERLADLHDGLRRNGHVVVHEIRVPRIVDVSGRMFWPPSREAVAKIVALRSAGTEPTFARVEGRDLSRAWEVFERHRGDASYPPAVDARERK